jgi:hypothetical protein
LKSNEVDLDISGLSSGIYSILIQTQESLLKSKIIKK